MKDAEVVIEQELRNIYYDPVAGYRSAEKLYQRAKEKGLSVSRRMVREWSKTQDTYTRYKSIVRKHKFRKIIVKDLAEQIGLDLVDMGKYKNKNKGYYWILMAVKILSRYAFTIPVYRKDRKNMTKAVELLLDNFKTRFGKSPDVAQFDEGKEFYNVGVRDLLKSHNVDYFSTKPDKKAAIVERFNRTLKTMMWKYFYSKGTYNWVDVLDELTENYNNTKHSSILMKPKDVNKSRTWCGSRCTVRLWASYRYLSLGSVIPLGLASIRTSSVRDTKLALTLQKKYSGCRRYSEDTLTCTK